MNGIKKDVVCIDNSNKTRHLGNHHERRAGESNEIVVSLPVVILRITGN